MSDDRPINYPSPLLTDKTGKVPSLRRMGILTQDVRESLNHRHHGRQLAVQPDMESEKATDSVSLPSLQSLERKRLVTPGVHRMPTPLLPLHVQVAR
jgi:hypothetical protein